MPNKKLQIFVSSTYTDMLAERQAIVEAILMSGHIPAGMELFAAGDRSQLETIRRWIKESDIFMLILGARYGSLEPDTGKSYIQLEYEYAFQEAKPVFAAVMSNECVDAKVKSQGKTVLELQHPEAYDAFKTNVLTRVCRFFHDTKDLKIIVLESISGITRDRPLTGWIRGDEVLDPKRTLEDMSNLQVANARLVKQVAELEAKLSGEVYNGLSFDERVNNLGADLVPLEGLPVEVNREAQEEQSLLNLFYAFRDQLTVGVENFMGIDKIERYVFYSVAPKLLVYGLVEKKAINNRGVQRFQTSALGNRFLAKIKPMFRKTAPASTAAVPSASPDKSGKKPARRRAKPAQG